MSVVVVEVVVSVLFEVDEEPEVLGVVAEVLGAAVPLLGVPALESLLWALPAALPEVDGVLPLLPEVWPIASPTPPTRAAAAASVVRVFLIAFISLLLDMETRSEHDVAAGKVERKTLAGAS